MQHPYLVDAHSSLRRERELNTWQWKGQNVEYVSVYKDDLNFIPFTSSVSPSQVLFIVIPTAIKAIVSGNSFCLWWEQK